MKRRGNWKTNDKATDLSVLLAITFNINLGECYLGLRLKKSVFY